jgi:hypothetical protein
MIGYVTLGTNDLKRAAAFYDAIAKEVGVGRMMENETFIAWGKQTQRFFHGLMGPGRPILIPNCRRLKLASPRILQLNPRKSGAR